MFQSQQYSRVSQLISSVLIIIFTITSVVPSAQAQALALPQPGAMVGLSKAFAPVLLRGMTVHPDNPLQFDFIVDSGHATQSTAAMEKESERLVKYFLASMTVPQNDLWVNLSPSESDRIIPEELSKTELGRDLLAQDYLLKQLSASLMHPEGDVGKQLWQRIHAKAQQTFGANDIPMDTLNKVWIVPERAEVYEYENTVYVVDAHLKVMLDRDYLANGSGQKSVVSGQSSAQIVKDVVLPEIEKEINTGQNFAPLRQIYYSLILAKWYKQTVQNSLLKDIYIDQNKVFGVDHVSEEVKHDIYHQYMAAYKKGVFNFIQEDYDALSQQTLPRKYFSGGFSDQAMTLERQTDAAAIAASIQGPTYSLRLQVQPQVDAAMTSEDPLTQWITEDVDVFRKGIAKEFDSEEWPVALVDEKGHLTGEYMDRKEAHAQGAPHMVAHIYMFDSRGRIVLQKRSMNKSSSPGKLQVSASGHVDFNTDAGEAEAPMESAVREAEEELGVAVDISRLEALTDGIGMRKFNTTRRGGNNREFVHAWAYVLTDKELGHVQKRFNLRESEEIWVMPINHFERMISKAPDVFSDSLKLMTFTRRDKEYQAMKDFVAQQTGDKTADAAMKVESHNKGMPPLILEATTRLKKIIGNIPDKYDLESEKSVFLNRVVRYEDEYQNLSSEELTRLAVSINTLLELVFSRFLLSDADVDSKSDIVLAIEISKALINMASVKDILNPQNKPLRIPRKEDVTPILIEGQVSLRVRYNQPEGKDLEVNIFDFERYADEDTPDVRLIKNEDRFLVGKLSSIINIAEQIQLMGSYDENFEERISVKEGVDLQKIDYIKMYGLLWVALDILGLVSDAAVLSEKTPLGGIDMNDISVEREGGVTIEFQRSGFEYLLDQNINGFRPVIINFQPLPSILPLLGLAPRDPEEELVLGT